jgi:hypothetical protein
MSVMKLKRSINLRFDFLDDRTEELARWISPLNFNEQHDAAFAKHSKGTGTWFLESSEFKDWTDDQHKVLWCPGKRTFLALG